MFEFEIKEICEKPFNPFKVHFHSPCLVRLPFKTTLMKMSNIKTKLEHFFQLG
jgi:hypothetical protein